MSAKPTENSRCAQASRFTEFRARLAENSLPFTVYIQPQNSLCLLRAVNLCSPAPHYNDAAMYRSILMPHQSWGLKPKFATDLACLGVSYAPSWRCLFKWLTCMLPCDPHSRNVDQNAFYSNFLCSVHNGFALQVAAPPTFFTEC